MPIVDGYTAFSEIRKINPDVPIIAVTAYAYTEDRKKIIQFGFDDYISKPFDLKEVGAKISKIIYERKNQKK